MNSVMMRRKHILPTNPPTNPTIPVTMGGRTEGPRAGCELLDNSPGSVTEPV